jgi:predicted nucleotidyltransferase
MVNEKINIIINELVNELKSRYADFRGIYLFGSYARGEANDDSDIDLAIVFDRDIDWRFKDSVREIIIDKEIEYKLIIDTHFYTSQELIEPATPFRENIITDGVFHEA